MAKLYPVSLLLFFWFDSRIACFFGESCLSYFCFDFFCFQIKFKMVSSEIWPVLNYLFELLLLVKSFWKFGIDHDPIFGWTFTRIPRSNQPVFKRKENEMSSVWNSDSTFRLFQLRLVLSMNFFSRWSKSFFFSPEYTHAGCWKSLEKWNKKRTTEEGGTSFSVRRIERTDTIQ
jgi:hypothetical protein